MSTKIIIPAWKWVILKYATTHNHPKVSTATQQLPKKAKTCHKQVCYCTLDVNTETDVGFDTDMKQRYAYMRACMSVCIYFISHYIYYFLVKLIACSFKHYK